MKITLPGIYKMSLLSLVWRKDYKNNNGMINFFNSKRNIFEKANYYTNNTNKIKYKTMCCWTQNLNSLTKEKNKLMKKITV